MTKNTTKSVVILDSNELIFGIIGNKGYPYQLMQSIAKLCDNFDFWISRQIVKEVLDNVQDGQKGEFFKLITSGFLKYDGKIVDRELFLKYRNKGLKKGDVVIAAFAEMKDADFLVSENRHFLKGLKTGKFRVLNAEHFLREVIK